MSHLDANTKHAILLEYIPRSRAYSFAALAQRHNIRGGRKTIQRWHHQWDGTAVSLKERKSTGRPRILTRQQVQQHIRQPILDANRTATAIHYPQLRPRIQSETGRNPSIRTIRRYGKNELQARNKTTTKRKRDECKCIHERSGNQQCL